MHPLVSALLVACLAAPVARACDATSDCAVTGGTYRLALPASVEQGGKIGAIVFLHGYGASPEDMMDFHALRDTANRLGVALIAPRGEEKRWHLPGAFPPARDDVAFVRAVTEDAEARFPIDPDRVMIAGFSLGASMTWYIACAEGNHYAGYAAVAGSFWEPYVDSCALPLPDLYHVHGLADETVPMAGRKLSVATQGDTYRSFALLRRLGQCETDLAPEPAEGALTCSVQQCDGAIQELCLHQGGHEIRPEWIERAWTRLAQEKGWS